MISTLLSKLDSISCTWWSYPKWMTNTLKPLTKLKKEWTMPCYKGKGKDWMMDIPMLLTWKELLTAGTEKDLDWWYKKLSGEAPKPGSTLKLTLSKFPMAECTTELDLMPEETFTGWNNDDSYWFDTKSGLICWLCPYLPWLMGGIPEKLYIKMELSK